MPVPVPYDEKAQKNEGVSSASTTEIRPQAFYELIMLLAGN